MISPMFKYNFKIRKDNGSQPSAIHKCQDRVFYSLICMQNRSQTPELATHQLFWTLQTENSAHQWRWAQTDPPLSLPQQCLPRHAHLSIKQCQHSASKQSQRAIHSHLHGLPSDSDRPEQEQPRSRWCYLLLGERARALNSSLLQEATPRGEGEGKGQRSNEVWQGGVQVGGAW